MLDELGEHVHPEHTTAGSTSNPLICPARQSLRDMNAGQGPFFTLPTVADHRGKLRPGVVFIARHRGAAVRCDHQRSTAAGRERHERDAEPAEAPPTPIFQGPAGRAAPVPRGSAASSPGGQNVTGRSPASTSKSGLATTAEQLSSTCAVSDLLKCPTRPEPAQIHQGVVLARQREAAAVVAAAAGDPGSTLDHRDGLGIGRAPPGGARLRDFTLTVVAEIPATLLARVHRGSAGQVASVTLEPLVRATTSTEDPTVTNAADTHCM